MNNPLITNIISQLKHYCIQLYGDDFEQLILFGSQARGEATQDSDIDLLLIIDREEVNVFTEQDLLRHFKVELELKHQVLLQIMVTSKHNYLQSNDPLYLNVRREGITL